MLDIYFYVSMIISSLVFVFKLHRVSHHSDKGSAFEYALAALTSEVGSKENIFE